MAEGSRAAVSSPMPNLRNQRLIIAAGPTLAEAASNLMAQVDHVKVVTINTVPTNVNVGGKVSQYFQIVALVENF